MAKKKKHEELSEKELDAVQGGDGKNEGVWLDLGFPLRTAPQPPQQIGGDPDGPVITGRVYNGK